MPIIRHTNQSNRLTTFTATGAITLPDIFKILDTFKDAPPTKDILWDFSNAEVGDSFTVDDMERMAKIAKFSLGVRDGGKTAFVAKTDHAFGLIRMYTTYLEFQKIAHEIHVFRTLEKAHQWLEES